MKLALLLSGKIGGTAGKDGKGGLIDFELCCRHYKKHIIDRYNCDVFIHSWSVDHEQELLELYRPKKYIFETQIDFSSVSKQAIANRGTLFRLRSKWFSMVESIKLKIKYEKEMHERYDWVMISRFDLMMLKPFCFEGLDSNFLYVPPIIKFLRNCKAKRWQIPPQRNICIDKKILGDYFFIGNSKIIDEFLKFHRGANISANIHKVLWKDIKQFIGEPSKVVRFLGYRGQEYDLYRWRICHSTS